MFSLGIGTIWDKLGVTGTTAQNCPYRGPHANAEYNAITGCAVVPLETHGTSGDGTYCAHWDETCLGVELMTGYIDNGGRYPLSRITIGSMEDIGYTVDYSAADSFVRADIATSCRCNRRSLMDMFHGETRQLGLGMSSTKKRHLSAETRQVAIDYGLSLLAERVSFLRSAPAAPVDGISYIGDKVVSVVVADGDGIFSVVVRR